VLLPEVLPEPEPEVLEPEVLVPPLRRPRRPEPEPEVVPLLRPPDVELPLVIDPELLPLVPEPEVLPLVLPMVDEPEVVPEPDVLPLVLPEVEEPVVEPEVVPLVVWAWAVVVRPKPSRNVAAQSDIES
jgi:hypothetical protein